jgi:hypothetical protein
MKEIFNEQLEREVNIDSLQKHLDVLAVNNDFSESYHFIAKKLSKQINKGAWREKELIHIKKQLDRLRKHQGFSKIARAFMAIGEDPTLANVTTSIIQSNSGDNQDNVESPNDSKPSAIPINATDSEEFTIGNLSQGDDANKITDQLQADFVRIEKEFQDLMQVLTLERKHHDQERTSILNESMELKSAVINSKRENDKLRDELSLKLKQQSDLIQELTEESLRLTQQQLLSPVQTTSQNSVHTVPVNRISSPIQKMLNNYDNLDEDTKKHYLPIMMHCNEN